MPDNIKHDYMLNKLRLDDITPLSTSNVSNPPTDAELDALFGTPAQAGTNFQRFLDDSNSDNCYIILSNGSQWYYTTMIKAV